MTTKIDVINGSYSRLRISGLTVTPSPELQELALERLEDMMSELEYSRNMCMDYNFEISPDPNSLTNVRQPYWAMMKTNLAVRLVPDFNKQVPRELTLQAGAQLSTASSAISARNTREIQYPRRMAIGSGNSYKYNRFQLFQHPSPLPPNECETNILVVGDINDYEESYRAYLKDTETIDTFTLTTDNSLLLLSSSNNDPIINYQMQALEISTTGIWQQVKIIIATNLGRRDTRLINFEIKDNETVGHN